MHKYALDKDPAMIYMARVIRGADTADKTITRSHKGSRPARRGASSPLPDDQKQGRLHDRSSTRSTRTAGRRPGEVTLRRLAFVEVPRGAKPGFDHADVLVAPAGSRMYVAHTGDDRVDVFDCGEMVPPRSCGTPKAWLGCWSTRSAICC